MNYELRIKNVIKNKKGTALFMSLMILSGVLIVSLGAAGLVMSGIKQGRTQTHSTKAYFAAEAGAERALWEIRKNGADLSSCVAGTDYIIFDNINIPPPFASVICGPEQINTLSNSAAYSVLYQSNISATTTVSVGNFNDVKRSVEVSY